MSGDELKMNCSEVASLLVFLSCDEVSAEERTAIESHLGGCADCRALMVESGEFQETIAGLPQTADELDRSGMLLAQCRSELAESLDYRACRTGALAAVWLSTAMDGVATRMERSRITGGGRDSRGTTFAVVAYQ
jgi:predicted anti-sigma-YlaC factor YlaD